MTEGSSVWFVGPVGLTFDDEGGVLGGGDVWVVCVTYELALDRPVELALK